MRLFLVAALAVTAFVATMAIQTTDANAVVCKRVGYPKGCVAAAPAVRAAPAVGGGVVYCKTRGVPKGCVMR
jgi:hypothetical protein